MRNIPNEGTQSWFNINEEHGPLHNHVNTRRELKDYDPDLGHYSLKSTGIGSGEHTACNSEASTASSRVQSRGFPNV